MKYLATGPWMAVGEKAARRAVVYRTKQDEFVVHTQYFCEGNVEYSHGEYCRFDWVAIETWRKRVNELFDTTYKPAPIETVEAAELAALANRLAA